MGASIVRGIRNRPILVAIGVAVIALLVSFPWIGGSLAASRATAMLRDRLGLDVKIGEARAGFSGVVFRTVQIGDAPAGGLPPLASIAEIQVPFSVALFRKGEVAIKGVMIDARRGGSNDNVTQVVAALRRGRQDKSSAPPASAEAPRIPSVLLTEGHVKVRDAASGLSVEIGQLGAHVVPGASADVRAEKIAGVLALGSSGQGPHFGAASVAISQPLAGARPRGYPEVTVEDGYAAPLPKLSLTGIRGKISSSSAAKAGDQAADDGPAGGAAPAPGAAAKKLIVDLAGSYGGARETLWTAKGDVDPATRAGQITVRAERFTLGEIGDVLPKTILSPGETHVDAALDVSWAEGAVRFGGDMRVAGLNIDSAAVAAEPVRGLDLGLVLRGTAFPATRRVSIDRLEGSLGGLRGVLSGFVELGPGSFTFADGSKLSFLPRLDLRLEVPKLPCAKALAALPPATVPHLQGFVLQGTFGAEIETRIDYADLESMELKAKIGIDGCKVLKVPPEVKALVDGDSVKMSVEVPRAFGAKGGEDTEQLDFMVGPENPDFVPYEDISPFLTASILTTEDNGFFKHRGWVSSEFRNALKRNLQRGGFRGGASSITMQMVKNVLLSQQKTLSRKLQELFLVWYLEQEVPKERILELYFNAIEFGPRIYGIGPAVKHYFGKTPAELRPLEAAFFSSILPSPKRRYVQYCHGVPLAQWDKYVRRILAKEHERGRINDEDFAAAQSEKLVFDRWSSPLTEKQCLDWVKKITARPEPEIPADAEALDTDADGDRGPLPGKARHRGGKGKVRDKGAGAKEAASGAAKASPSP